MKKFNINNWQILKFEELESTQDYAKELLQNPTNKNQTAIQAVTQTKGRGRKHGRIWQSPTGNLYLSSIIALDNIKLPELSMTASLVIKNTIQKIGINENDIRLKYPNDVLIHEQKISGILIEQSNNHAIIGTGINIAHAPTQNLNYSATSLSNEGIDISTQEILKTFLQELESSIKKLKEEGYKKIINEWKKSAYKIGKEITVTENDKTHHGLFEDITDNGLLKLKTKTETMFLSSGDISIKYK
jgi:BirA family biotin operon repressor/biotin-[acetyl-CoA-carboxylase] ligase